MSHRPAVKSPFEGLRPSIVREPSRTAIRPEDELSLLQAPAKSVPAAAAERPGVAASLEAAGEQAAAPVVIQGGTLLTKKRREVLIPVTFRIPQTLKEQLNEIARKHEINQTDLINEGIELNLQRYR